MPESGTNTQGQRRKNNMQKKRHCITWADRLKIEALMKAKHSPKEIADQLGYHFTTIYREIKRGRTTRRNSDWTESVVYSPDLAQRKYEEQLKTKGREWKVGNDREFVEYVEKKILDEKYSPAAVLASIEKGDALFDTKICLSTLYNYIRSGEIFLNLTLSQCPGHQDVKKKKKKKVQKRASKGESIEQRPQEVENREEFGHWEMDTVIGKSKDKKSLLVLTERKTRMEIVELLKEHTAAQVVKALDRIERRYTEAGFRKIFKTITVDNGSEFADLEGIERSRRNKKKRTKLYYCHPYSSYERGSNENQNKLIRRFFPKGETMTDVKPSEVKKAQDWMNRYPRKLLGWKSPEELFGQELEALAM